MMKKSFVALLLSLLTLPVMAGDRWVQVGEFGKTKLFIDSESYVFLNDGTLRLWVRDLYNEPTHSTYLTNKEFNLIDAHIVISCDSRTYFAKERHFYLNGEDVDYWLNQNPEWISIQPESKMEQIFKVCTLKPKRKNQS